MALWFNWNKLDTTCTEWVRAAINAKLRTFLSSAVASGKNSALSAVELLEVAALKFGEVAPFVELREFGAALDLSLPDLPATINPDPLAGGGGVSGCGSGASSVAAGGASAPWQEHTQTPLGVTPPQQQPRRMDSDDGSSDDEKLSSRESGAPLPTTDRLAQFFGPSGLFLQFRVTYGGNLGVKIACRVKQTIQLTPNCSIGVVLPITFEVSQVRLDFLLNVNLHKDAIALWFSESGLCDVPLDKLSIVAQFGEPREGQPCSSSGAALSPSTCCIDRTVIAQFVLCELQAMLRHRCVSPSYMLFPLPPPTAPAGGHAGPPSSPPSGLMSSPPSGEHLERGGPLGTPSATTPAHAHLQLADGISPPLPLGHKTFGTPGRFE